MHAHITRQQVFLAPQEGPKTVIKVRKMANYLRYLRFNEYVTFILKSSFILTLAEE